MVERRAYARKFRQAKRCVVVIEIDDVCDTQAAGKPVAERCAQGVGAREEDIDRAVCVNLVDHPTQVQGANRNGIDRLPVHIGGRTMQASTPAAITQREPADRMASVGQR